MATPALPLVVPFLDEVPVVVAVPPLPPWAVDQLLSCRNSAARDDGTLGARRARMRRTADNAVIAISVFFIASSVSG